jgi:hypothetical protein
MLAVCGRLAVCTGGDSTTRATATSWPLGSTAFRGTVRSGATAGAVAVSMGATILSAISSGM